MSALHGLRPGEPVEFTDGRGGRYRGVVGDDGSSVVDVQLRARASQQTCALCSHNRREHDTAGCAHRHRSGSCVCLKFRRPERTP
jgi:hypothetical protein